MQDKVHRAISEQIAKLLDPNRNWEILITASVAPDWMPSSLGHHRRKEPIQDIDLIVELVRSARKEYLRNRFSDEFEKPMGKAFHYIQDRFIQSRDRSLHARFEAAISRALPELVPWAEATLLKGEKEVLSYLRNEVEFMEDPAKLLNQAFVVCFSVAKAICDKERGFKKGISANKLTQTLYDQLAIVSKESYKLLDRFRTKLDQIVNSMKERYDNTCKHYLYIVKNRKSPSQKIISFLLLEDWRYKRKLDRIKKESIKRMNELITKQRKAYDTIKCSQKESVIQTIQKVEKLLATEYENDYEVRRISPMWYWIPSITDFKSPDELRQSIEGAREKLHFIEEEWDNFFFGLEKEKQRMSEFKVPARDSNKL